MIFSPTLMHGEIIEAVRANVPDFKRVEEMPPELSIEELKRLISLSPFCLVGYGGMVKEDAIGDGSAYKYYQTWPLLIGDKSMRSRTDAEAGVMKLLDIIRDLLDGSTFTVEGVTSPILTYNSETPEHSGNGLIVYSMLFDCYPS